MHTRDNKSSFTPPQPPYSLYRREVLVHAVSNSGGRGRRTAPCAPETGAVLSSASRIRTPMPPYETRGDADHRVPFPQNSKCEKPLLFFPTSELCLLVVIETPILMMVVSMKTPALDYILLCDDVTSRHPSAPLCGASRPSLFRWGMYHLSPLTSCRRHTANNATDNEHTNKNKSTIAETLQSQGYWVRGYLKKKKNRYLYSVDTRRKTDGSSGCKQESRATTTREKKCEQTTQRSCAP